MEIRYPGSVRAPQYRVGQGNRPPLRRPESRRLDGTSAAPGEWGSAATSQPARVPPGHETVLLISARRAGCTEESIRYEICYC